MLKQITEGVLVHESEFLQSHTVVVRGATGVLLIDPGLTRDELACIANDIHELGLPVIAGFSTHPDWDHVLWHAKFGDVPRYSTARGAAEIRDFMSKEDWKTQLADYLPPEYIDDIPLDGLFGRITGLPAGTVQIPWDGPTVRIIEHEGHAHGHAALLVEDSGVLVAGDMLSDTLVPFLLMEAADPAGDYLTGLERIEAVADKVKFVVPGHGSIGDGNQLRARINMDRAYVRALLEGRVPDDPRVGATATYDWLADMPKWQLQQLAEKKSSRK